MLGAHGSPQAIQGSQGLSLALGVDALECQDPCEVHRAEGHLRMVVAQKLAPTVQDLAQDLLGLGIKGQVAEDVAPIAHQRQRAEFVGRFSGQRHSPFKKLSGLADLAFRLQHQAEIVESVRHFALGGGGILGQDSQGKTQVGFRSRELAAHAPDVTAFAIGLGGRHAAGSIDTLAVGNQAAEHLLGAVEDAEALVGVAHHLQEIGAHGGLRLEVFRNARGGRVQEVARGEGAALGVERIAAFE